MKNLICPNCGKPFSIDDADYAQLLSQVKNDEFKAEVDSRVSELRSLWLQEQEAASLKAENAHQQALNVQEKKLQEREAEIQTLKERLSSVEQIKAAELKQAVSEKETAMQQKLSAAEQKLQKQLSDTEQKMQHELSEALQKIRDLEAAQRVAVLEEQQKAEASLREKETELMKLRNDQQLAASQALMREQNIKEQYEQKLKLSEEQVAYYKDLKTRMSTKMVGETLEIHCSTLFNQNLRPLMPSAYFEKDNDASGGSKGDFIFRDSVDGQEYVSIMFEMKNEMDETASKHKNEDFFAKLDKDRREKGCEYAVLVSMLEPESELYNGGIVDVSYKYEKMYVPIGVAYGSDLPLVKEVLTKELTDLLIDEVDSNGDPLIRRDYGVKVVMQRFGDSSVDMVVLFWMLVKDEIAWIWKVREHIYKALNDHHIEIPFPQRDIHVRDFPQLTQNLQHLD